MLSASQFAGAPCQQPHIPEEGTRFRPGELAVATRMGGGGSLTGKQADLPAEHRQELPLLQQVPRASCSSSSGSDQQDGTAQAEGSLQGGTPCRQKEGGIGAEGRQEELPGLLSWLPSSRFKRGSDRRPFSPLPSHRRRL